MASGHPVDAQGRVLPRCDWPSDKRAPGSLETVRLFCNTANLESGADRLADADDFVAWLSEQGHDVFRPSRSDIARCVDLREALRDAAGSHRSGEDSGHALAQLESLVGDVRFVIGLTDTGLTTTLAPDQDPVQRFIGSIALAVTTASSGGIWTRLKACRHCRWVVYDSSKNRSAQWCSMSACGGRSKVHRHRARRRATEPSRDDPA